MVLGLRRDSNSCVGASGGTCDAKLVPFWLFPTTNLARNSASASIADRVPGQVCGFGEQAGKFPISASIFQVTLNLLAFSRTCRHLRPSGGAKL